jgi:hypothetical protein
MTAIATCRTCGTEPLENARFCHGCGSPVKDGDTRAEYKQVMVLFAACGTEPPPNDELTQAEWIDAARKAAFAERTPASPHQVRRSQPAFRIGLCRPRDRRAAFVLFASGAGAD